ncbi:MAG: YdiU family protein [Cyanobacteria bacterium P01_E01_bin.34]
MDDRTLNPLFQLNYDPAFEALGDEFYDPVNAATFPQTTLRWRNDAVLSQLGLKATEVSDRQFIEAFGRFGGPQPCLVLRYHGYQFGEYNPRLGDGRGFLYGQVRGTDGELYDFGTKGSGQTPYSRGGDGRLTLKGGVREIIASEALHAMGVRTSRCLSVIETGESLWRGDEPSPTRSSVMVRFSRSHIRFGTFERLHHIHRPDLARQLLNHVIETYYPQLIEDSDRDSSFYLALVERTAELAAQWMAAGFCHAVLNTDNMSITGESFDYGPYAFVAKYDPKFTAAYFDYWGRYRYANQPNICRLNLEVLQKSLANLIPPGDMEVALAQFDSHYQTHHRKLMLHKLGFETLPLPTAAHLVRLTLQVLEASAVEYADFFNGLRKGYQPTWGNDDEYSDAATAIATIFAPQDDEQTALVEQWQAEYIAALKSLSTEEREAVTARLTMANLGIVPTRPVIESIWEPITTDDNWEPLYDLLTQIAVNSPSQ